MGINVKKKQFWAIVAASIMVLAILFSAIAPFAFGAEEVVEDVATRERPTRGKVLVIMEDTVVDQGGGYSMRYQVADVKILEGPFKGQVIQIENYINVYNMVLSPKDEVLLFVVPGNDGRIEEAFVAEIGRDKYLIWIAAIFLAMVVLIGGMKGVKTIITLLLTVLAVIFILMPLVMKGYNPIGISTVVCIVITIVSLLILNGIQLKTMSAIIGTVSGIIIAATLAWVFGSMAKLTGMGNEYAQLLAHMEFEYDFKGLLFAAIMLGSLGAVMDVSMSISSAMHEILAIDPTITQKNLFKSGMNIGRDLMGTMSNTLILAYAGGALHMILCFMADGVSFFEIINRDLIASEVVRAMSGSIGLISAIPITTFVVTMLRSNQQIEDTE